MNVKKKSLTISHLLFYPEGQTRMSDLFILVILSCIIYPSVGQFMPGSSPATPNNALITCQAQAIKKQLNLTFQGQHAYVINQWCSSYESMLPCLQNRLPLSSDPNDWFLNLVYNQTMATRMSKSMCNRFRYLTNLTCVDGGLPRVAACMKWTTRSAINHFYNLYDVNATVAEENKDAASIYACIISVATAGCFRRELKMCSIPKRKLLYDYYIMLSGQCKEIAGLPDKTKSTTTTAPDDSKDRDTTPSAATRETTRQPTRTTPRRSSASDDDRRGEPIRGQTGSRGRNRQGAASGNTGQDSGSAASLTVSASLIITMTTVLHLKLW